MGLFISSKNGIYNSTEPIVETVEVPSRGTLIIDNRADELDNEEFNEYEKSYTCFISADDKGDLERKARAIYRWLFCNIEYDRLYDTYDCDYYVMARVLSKASLNQLASNILGELEVKFMCRPFKKLIKGEKKIVISKPTTIVNPEAFTSSPYLKIVGNGAITIYINNRSYSFKEVSDYIELDSELMNAYKENALQNNKMISTKFPKLVPGSNDISWMGDVTKIEMVPRWCSL